VNKIFLNVSIVVSGLLLGVFHYELKPKPAEKDVSNLAQQMTNSTEWKGQIAPDFEIQTIDGGHFQLSEAVGKKVIVLNFFATWCGPCREEMPELNRYFSEHKNESFLLLGIDSHEPQRDVEGFVQELNVSFPVGIDAGAISDKYGVDGFPTTVVIGVDGKVQFYESGALANADVAFDNLLSQNLALLKQGKGIAPEDYRREASKQHALPVHKTEATTSTQEETKVSPRAKQIASRMDCPCGCVKKVQNCTCNTSSKIKNALTHDDIQGQSDDEVIKSLNKRFCVEAM
jgi:thiol-disulfide isomerase/thioredoxin